MNNHSEKKATLVIITELVNQSKLHCNLIINGDKSNIDGDYLHSSHNE